MSVEEVSSVEGIVTTMTIQNGLVQPETSSSKAIDNPSDNRAEIIGSESQVTTKPNNDNNENNNTTNTTSENSLSSTAFTISFEDEAAPEPKKKFSVRDSIRKFAPPKQFTKPPSRREQDLAQQESSLMSIESLPGNLSNHQSGDRFRRDTTSKFSRSNQHRSSLCRPTTNLSESAAFLIDRMLNPSKKNNDSLDQSPANTKATGSRNVSSPTHGLTTKDQRPPLLAKEASGVEVDFWEDKSDNGTYIVGADPESDAARAKIDELFGVVKAAEASIIEESLSPNNIYNRDECDKQQRRSRQTDKRQMSRERQEHINRLAYKDPPRSSSASRQDQASVRQHRSSSRHSRDSSCERNLSSIKNRRPHRSASQTSRNSGHREHSDAETKSSKSSLQNQECDNINQGNTQRDTTSISSHPNMKFNRAFALRRARLGLAEPVKYTQPQGYDQHQQPESLITMSPRRQQQLQSSPTQVSPSSSSRGFSRDDGGRYSLRTRNSILPVRVSASSHRSPQHVYTHRPNHSAMVSGPLSEQVETSSVHYSTGNPTSRYERFLARTQEQLYSRRHQDSAANSMLQHEEFDQPDPQNRPGRNDYERLEAESLRAASGMSSRLDDSGVQLGALDSLVISAISNISLNIRHSICDVLVEQSRKLPEDNETRLVVEEILPSLEADSKSSTVVEEIDQSLYFELARTLKNLKKVEQMVAVINQISNQLQIPQKSMPSSPQVLSPTTNNTSTTPASSPNSSSKSKSTETAHDVEGSQKNSADLN